MPKIVWATWIFVIAAGLGLVFYMGARPKPVAKIKSAHFETASEMGEVIFDRIWGELKGTNIYIFGIGDSQKTDHEMWLGLQNRLQENQIRFANHYVHKGLGQFYMNQDEIDFVLDFKALAEKIAEAKVAQQSIAIYVPNDFTDDRNHPGSFYEKVLESVATKGGNPSNVVMFSTLPVAVTPGGESKLGFDCDGNRQRTDGFGYYYCLAIYKSRTLAKKPKDAPASRYVLAMDQVGARHYLVYHHAPN